jgi:hypothetical protein
MEMQVKPVLGAPSQGESGGLIVFPWDCRRDILCQRCAEERIHRHPTSNLQ